MKLSFYKRVVLLLCGVVSFVQILNLTGVLATISGDVRSNMHKDLEVASELVEQLVERRADLLLTSAGVLAADFGFRSALASQDKATIVSALENNVDRVGADLATLITLDGQMIGTSTISEEDRIAYSELAKRAEVTGSASATLEIGGVAREVVSVPVKAPITIGWLVLGFALNDDIAQAFSNQLGMQVTFAARTNDVDYNFYGSSFTGPSRDAMPTAMQNKRQTDSGLVTTLVKEDFLTQIVPISSEQQRIISVLHTSLDEALAGYRIVRNRLLWFMAMSVIIAIALGLWFARGVTRPIKLLSIAALRIREGDYQTELDSSRYSHRADEIGELIKTFDEMQYGIAEREAKITHHAYYDDLTQLPNRRMAGDQLQLLIDSQADEKSQNTGSIGVIVIGLNRYKQIVETLGYQVGEQMVLKLSERLQDIHPQQLTIARASTDEFLVFLTSTDLDRCKHTAITTIEAMEQPIILDDAELIPDLSAGLVLIPEFADNAADAIRRASIALADARDAEERTGSYIEGREESHLRRLSIVADLKQAVDRDELILHFQPKINMQTMQVTSVEALVRWIHPQHGFMPPDEFIGLAESSGNIGLLTTWVLNAVIQQIKRWEFNGINIKAAVNLSALDLQDESLLARIHGLLNKHDVPPQRLILEVTESAMMRDTERALAILSQMRTDGLTISIDDFGTGYSSLAKLKDLPIDELKIDRAFVSDIEPDTAKAMIIKAIIDLGHSMDLTVISEGVETREEWDLLAELGNDVVQGYLISRPLTSADFVAWWHQQYPVGKRPAA